MPNIAEEQKRKLTHMHFSAHNFVLSFQSKYILLCLCVLIEIIGVNKFSRWKNTTKYNKVFFSARKHKMMLNKAFQSVHISTTNRMVEMCTSYVKSLKLDQ